jgi:predicted AAA+ superfamily ATPase
MYIVFRVRPYSKNIARSILKEPKIYFFDTGLVVGDEGAKFENLVANSLLKHIYHKNDYDAEDYQLHYLRTKEGLKVDFALANNEVVERIIEVKHKDGSLHKGLVSFSQKYAYPAVQVVKELKREYQKNGISVVKGINFLAGLS